MPLPLTVPCFSKIQIAFNFLVSAYPGGPRKMAAKRVYVYKKILVRPQIRILPSGSLFQTLDFKNIATASRCFCQRNSSTVELVDHTYDS